MSKAIDTSVGHNPMPATADYPSSASQANGPMAHDASPKPGQESPVSLANKKHSHKD
jgi:hypothetical protein